MDAASTASAPPARREPLVQVVERPDPSRGDHRDPHPVRDGAGQPDVVPVARSVPVHAGEQDLPRPVPLHPGSPLHGVDPRRGAPAVGVHLPLPRPTRDRTGVDRGHRALASRPLPRPGPGTPNPPPVGLPPRCFPPPPPPARPGPAGLSFAIPVPGFPTFPPAFPGCSDSTPV